MRKRIRNVLHQRPSTSRQLRPIAAPSPMFSTNIAGVTAIHDTKIQIQRMTGRTQSASARYRETRKSVQ